MCRWLLRGVMAWLALSCLTACERRPPIEWIEYVKVPDGRIVEVARYQEFKRPAEIGHPPGPSDYWLEFEHPTTRERIRWENDGELGTVALLFDADVPHLLASFKYGSGLRKAGCPNPPYLLFRYQDSGWRNLDLTTLPVKHLRSNMTYGAEDAEKRVQRGEKRLGLDYTQSLDFQGRRPWVMDFTQMKTQTFDRENCFRKLDYLVVRRPRKSEKTS